MAEARPTFIKGSERPQEKTSDAGSSPSSSLQDPTIPEATTAGGEDTSNGFDFCDATSDSNRSTVGPVSDLAAKEEEDGAELRGDYYPPLYFRSIHRVHCRDSRCDKRIYEEPPCPLAPSPGEGEGDERDHIAGAREITSVAAFVREKGLYFVSIQEWQCVRRDARPGELPADGGDVDTVHVVVTDQALLQTLRTVARCAVDIVEHGRSRAGLRPLYQPDEDAYTLRFLWHHRAALQAAWERQPDRKDLWALLWWVEDRLPLVDARFRDFQKGPASGMVVSTATLEWLFCPNDVVVVASAAASCPAGSSSGSVAGSHSDTDANTHTGNGNPTAYVLESWPERHVNGTLELRCWAWEFDGPVLRRRHATLELNMPARKQEVEATALPIYPLACAGEETRRQLLNAGRAAWAYGHGGPAVVEYYDDEDGRGGAARGGSRFVVDERMYKSVGQDRHRVAGTAKLRLGERRPRHGRWPGSVQGVEELTDECAMLLPPVVHGYSLRDRGWVRLPVDKFRPATWNKEAFDEVVLPQKAKDIVRALMLVHAWHKRQGEAPALPRGARLLAPEPRDLLLAGRRNDAPVIHLCGPPGTGKTLLAESVAELAEMPLLTLACGTIGPTAYEVEKHMDDLIRCCKSWNGVLLLKHADVFLGEVPSSDLERNNVVSAFIDKLLTMPNPVILTTSTATTTTTPTATAPSSPYLLSPLPPISPLAASLISVTLTLRPPTHHERFRIWKLHLAAGTALLSNRQTHHPRFPYGSGSRGDDSESSNTRNYHRSSPPAFPAAWVAAIPSSSSSCCCCPSAAALQACRYPLAELWRLAARRLSGRQIRDAVRLAQSLAVFEALGGDDDGDNEEEGGYACNDGDRDDYEDKEEEQKRDEEEGGGEHREGSSDSDANGNGDADEGVLREGGVCWKHLERAVNVIAPEWRQEEDCRQQGRESGTESDGIGEAEET